MSTKTQGSFTDLETECAALHSEVARLTAAITNAGMHVFESGIGEYVLVAPQPMTAERNEDSARLDWMEANKVELGHASVGNLVVVYVRRDGFIAVHDGHGIRKTVDVARLAALSGDPHE
jgi:hypothetical protein